jgi:hypothetical protein
MYGPSVGFLLPGRVRHNSPARNLAGDPVCIQTLKVAETLLLCATLFLRNLHPTEHEAC